MASGVVTVWLYQQKTGKMLKPTGELLATGYAGFGAGKNDPDMQTVRDIGPIPQGTYYIGAPRDTPTHGPFVLPLTPDESNKMFGRAGFLIHGDSVEHPGEASKGCIILPRSARNAIAASDCKVLKVVA
jgi:hypothetical protein